MSLTNSTLLTYGFFSLACGKRVAVSKPSPTTPARSTNGRSAAGSSQQNGTQAYTGNPVTYFMQYMTTFQCSLEDYLPAEVRVYSPPGDTTPYPDNTVVFMVARVSTADSAHALLDVLSMAPFPGDPTEPCYEESLPDVPNPHIVILGTVVGNPEDLAGGCRAFLVEAQAHVWGQRRTSVVK